MTMTFPRRALLSLFVMSMAACGGGSDSPTAPTPTPTTTRTIAVSGSLAFGDVSVGAQRDLNFTISNTGNAVLTVSGISVSGGFGSQLTASWTSGTVAAGGSQTVTVRFSPTSGGSYNGTVTVNGDQTSGANSLPISATVAATFTGTWTGSYIVERCDGTGSIQDLLCSQNRGLYPVGTSLPITMTLSQTGGSVTGTFALGQVTGRVNGGINGDVLTLQGSATSGTLTATISSWNTRMNGNSMEGNINYNFTAVGVGGVGALTTRLSNVTRR